MAIYYSFTAPGAQHQMLQSMKGKPERQELWGIFRIALHRRHVWNTKQNPPTRINSGDLGRYKEQSVEHFTWHSGCELAADGVRWLVNVEGERMAGKVCGNQFTCCPL